MTPAPAPVETRGIDVGVRLDGRPTEESAVLHVSLTSGSGEPAAAAAELRVLAARAATIGLRQLVADFDPADRTAWNVLDESELEWRVVVGADWARAVLRIS